MVVDLIKWFSPASETDVLGMIAVAHESAESQYSSDVYISARIRSDFAGELIDTLIPDYRGIAVFRAILVKDETVTAKDWLGAKQIMRSWLGDLEEEDEEIE